jgi:hypothetical protein
MGSGSLTIGPLKAVTHYVTMLMTILINGNLSSGSTPMTMTRRPTGSNPHEQTRLLPGITDASSDSPTGGLGSGSPRKRHGNAKYEYPYSKTCEVCSKPFLCHNRSQVVRNVTCSKVCAATAISRAMLGSGKPPSERSGMTEITCKVCGKVVWKAKSHVKRVAVPTCSRECNGTLRGQEWAKHASKGRTAWSEAAVLSFKVKQSGPTNHFWRGGVTYTKRRGNYPPVKMVLCPVEFATMGRKDGYIMEHRFIAARAMGRCLTSAEVVHHDNHDSTDNRVENLMVFASHSDHKLYEARGTPEPIWRGLPPSIIGASSGA